MPNRPSIRFAIPSKKLHGPNGLVRTATLLAVMQAHSDRISKALMDYDGFCGSFEPEPGYYLILLFQKSEGDLFTTIRPDTHSVKFRKSKLDYYSGLIGQEFDIVISSQRPLITP